VAEAPKARGQGPLLRELMNENVLTTTPQAPVTEAAAGMVRARVGSAVVMQGSFLAGILTERDVLRAAASAEDLRQSPVSAWMTSDPQSAAPDTPAAEAAQMMLLNGFRHLPVVDRGLPQVLGVVSLRELFAARIQRPAAERPAAG
jgi:CBS domain-containing protein